MIYSFFLLFQHFSQKKLPIHQSQGLTGGISSSALYLFFCYAFSIEENRSEIYVHFTKKLAIFSHKMKNLA